MKHRVFLAAFLALGATLTQAGFSQAGASVMTASVADFGTCQAAQENKLGNVPDTASEFKRLFDRDLDGVACETNGDDDQTAAATPSAPIYAPGARPATCNASPNVHTPEALAKGYLTPARTVALTYRVGPYLYVTVEDFACANGYIYKNEFGKISITSPEFELVMDGTTTTMNNQPLTLKHRLITIDDQAAASYTDLVDAFKLSGKGQHYHPVVLTLVQGQQP